MRVEYNLTQEDYLHFNEDYIQRSPTVRQSKTRFYLLPALVGVLTALLVAQHIETKIAAGVLIPILWLAYAPFYWKSSIRHRLRKLITEGNNSNLFGSHTFSIELEGMTETSEAGRSEMKWRGVSKVVTGEHGIYIYISAGSAYIVPNSAFTSDHQRQEFLETALRYREQAAGLLPVH